MTSATVAADGLDAATAGAGGAASAGVSVSEKPSARMTKLAGLMNPRQFEALKESKKGKAAGGSAPNLGADAAAPHQDAKGSAQGDPSPDLGAGAAAPHRGNEKAPKGASASGDASGLTPDGENVIDLGVTTSDGADGDGSGQGQGQGGTGEEQAPNVEGLEEGAKKRVLEAHKEAAKVRKRAQAAEKERDELKAERDRFKAQLEEAGTGAAGGGGSANMFVRAGLTDAKEVDFWAADAQKRINLLLDKSQESKLYKLPNGEEVDLSDDEAGSLIDAQQIIAQAKDWKELRQVQGQATEKAKGLAAKFEKVPEFATHHAEMAKWDLHAKGPLLVARASIGALIESGQYMLVKKGTKFSANAAGASSPASVVSGAQGDTTTAGSTARAVPPIEVARAVPAASRAGGEGGAVAIPSELTERAMKGDQEAVKEIIKLKTRGRQKAA